MDETYFLDINGMHCAACAARIEKAVSKIDGVNAMNVNLATEKGRVIFNQNKTSLSTIILHINKIGFNATKASNTSMQSNQEKQKEISALQWKFICSALLTLPLAWSMIAHVNWLSSVYVPVLFTDPFFQLAIAIPIQFIIGSSFYDRAWRALKSGSATMDVLVVLSTSTAFFYSHYLTFSSLSSSVPSQPIVLYYETSAFIITFILLGKLLEAKTKLKTTEAIKKLYHLQTKTATLYLDGKEQQTFVDHLVPGDILILKPGEKVPIDGQVLAGTSMVDESLLTGESVPVEKETGDLVYAGTINQNSGLTMKVTKRDSETVLSQIIHIVEEAQTSKAPIQNIADKITGFFVPVIILIALATFAVWFMIWQPGDFNEALEKGIAVLIIACPCALGLATPTSVMVGSGRAAELGILFKEGKCLELLGRCKTVVLDKTGTLTKGTPLVTDLYVEHLSQRTFMEIIGAAENNSDHPVAKAIVKAAKKQTKFLPTANHVAAIPGYGVKAFVNKKEVIIASPAFFRKDKYPLPVQGEQLISKLEKEGKTVMIAFIDTYFAGVIAIADELKPSSSIAVARLKQMDIEVVMLTGDNLHAGTAVARKIGISKYQTGVTPQNKAAIITQLQQDGDRVIMAGDGINDAPALAVANVGVAMGTGSDIAIESGDVTIIKGDLERLIDAIIISKKTMTNIKQNLLWAFIYNVLMIPFAIVGLMAPWLAGAAMAFSSVSVVLNALRLKKA